jgi:hypothetical protein
MDPKKSVIEWLLLANARFVTAGNYKFGANSRCSACSFMWRLAARSLS